MDPGFDDLPTEETADESGPAPGAAVLDGSSAGDEGDAADAEGADPIADGMDAPDPGAGDFASDGEAFSDGEAAGDGEAFDNNEAELARTPGERWMRRLRPLVLPGLLFVGVLVLIVRARHTLEQTPRFVVDPSVCSVVARPAWISESVARSIALSVATGLGRQASLLDGREMQRWADALTDPRNDISPWIQSVERLEPHFPSQADVRIRLWKPVLVLSDGLLVAETGRVLGPGPVAVSPAPLQYAGSHTDEDYVECAAAAGELLPYRDELERAGVRVTGVAAGADGTVSFTTENGVELSWGRSARKSTWSHLDLPPAERIGNLRQVLVDFPGLAGLSRVQLWTDRPVTVLREG